MLRQGSQTLLIKDVDWDQLKMTNDKFSTYKELRSLIKSEKMTFTEAQNIITKHLQKKL